MAFLALRCDIELNLVYLLGLIIKQDANSGMENGQELALKVRWILWLTSEYTTFSFFSDGTYI